MEVLTQVTGIPTYFTVDIGYKILSDVHHSAMSIELYYMGVLREEGMLHLKCIIT